MQEYNEASSECLSYMGLSRLLGGIRWPDGEADASNTFSVEYVAPALNEPVWPDHLKPYAVSLQNLLLLTNACSVSLGMCALRLAFIIT